MHAALCQCKQAALCQRVQAAKALESLHIQFCAGLPEPSCSRIREITSQLAMDFGYISGAIILKHKVNLPLGTYHIQGRGFLLCQAYISHWQCKTNQINNDHDIVKTVIITYSFNTENTLD